MDFLLSEPSVWSGILKGSEVATIAFFKEDERGVDGVAHVVFLLDESCVKASNDVFVLEFSDEFDLVDYIFFDVLLETLNNFTGDTFTFFWLFLKLVWQCSF